MRFFSFLNMEFYLTLILQLIRRLNERYDGKNGKIKERRKKQPPIQFGNNAIESETVRILEIESCAKCTRIKRVPMEICIHRTIISLSSLVYRFIIICYIDVEKLCILARRVCTHNKRYQPSQSHCLCLNRTNVWLAFYVRAPHQLNKSYSEIYTYTYRMTEIDRERQTERQRQ